MEDGIPGGLQHHHEMCCEKGGCRGRWACMVQRWHHYRDVVFRTGGLVYNILLVFAIEESSIFLAKLTVVVIAMPLDCLALKLACYSNYSLEWHL